MITLESLSLFVLSQFSNLFTLFFLNNSVLILTSYTFAVSPTALTVTQTVTVSLETLAFLAGAGRLPLCHLQPHPYLIVEFCLEIVVAFGASASLGGADLSGLHALAVTFLTVGFQAITKK